jgi:diacylglycerol kinase
MFNKAKGMLKREQFAVWCAVSGIIQFVKKERRSALYMISTTTVFTAGWVFGATTTEFILLAGAACSVWVSEMFNTCVEEILNLLHPNIHPKVKRIKDIAAGAVALTCACSVITALVIFLPKII